MRKISFIILIALLNTVMWSQTQSERIGPGGVFEDLRVWLKVDDEGDIVLEKGKNVDVWKDNSGNFNNFSFKDLSSSKKDGSPTIVYHERSMNFNNTVHFGDRQFLAIDGNYAPNKANHDPRPMTENSPLGVTTFVIYYAEDNKSDKRLYTHGFGGTDPTNDSGTRYPAMGFAPEEGVGRLRNDGATSIGNNHIQDGNIVGFNLGATAMQMIKVRNERTDFASNDKNRFATITHDFGGWQDVITTNKGKDFAEGFKLAQGATIGGASRTKAQFLGNISEVIFFEKELDKYQQEKVQSYLAVKYGITMDVDRNDPYLNYDYVLSDETKVWPGNYNEYLQDVVNWKYHNNVAGLVRDDASESRIYKTRSTGLGSILTLYTQGTELYSNISKEFDQDLSAVFFGDNGKSVSQATYVEDKQGMCLDYDFGIDRIWLIDKTNIDQITLNVNAGGADFAFNGDGYQVYLLLSNDEQRALSGQWDRAIVGNYIGGKDGEHTFELPLQDKYTYISFGAVEVQGKCETCEFDKVKQISFLETDWQKGNLQHFYNLGDNFTVDVKVIDENTTMQNNPTVIKKGYPKASGKTSLEILRKAKLKNDTESVTTLLELSSSALLEFDIYNVDKKGKHYDEVEVYGLCGTTVIKPVLSYSTSQDKSSYEIVNQASSVKAVANEKSSSYTGVAGTVHVEFERAVSKVYVKYTVRRESSSSAKTKIGIGSLSFRCPSSIPVSNEDGLYFSLQADQQVSMCEDVVYTYRITNNNCETKVVPFENILPEGLLWKKDGLSIDNVFIEGAFVNAYQDSKELKIDRLKIPGGKTLTFRARAYFSKQAQVQDYENKASFTYKRRLAKQDLNDPDMYEDVTLESCDFLSSDQCNPTITTALAATQFEPILVDLQLLDKKCFTEDSQYTFLATYNNGNTYDLAQTNIDIYFNEEFQVIKDSLKSTSIDFSKSEIEVEEGSLSIEDFLLPVGESTITFVLKAPKKIDLQVDSLTQKVLDLNVFIELSSDNQDVCLNSAVYDSFTELNVEYCSVCYMPGVIDQNFVSPTDYVNISTLDTHISNDQRNANAFLVLDSFSKGFVPTRLHTLEITKIESPVEGMIVFDVDQNCLKLFNGLQWGCIIQSCVE